MRIIVTAITFLIASVLSAQAPVGKLETGNLTYNFGTVAQGTMVQHDFLIKNNTAKVINIEDVVPACGCTVAKAHSTTLNPGESTAINARFDTAGFSGTLRKTIQVLTSENEQGPIVFRLEGEVASEIKVTPDRIFLGSVNKKSLSDIAPVKVELKLRQNGKVKIADIRSENPAIKISKLRPVETGQQFEVTFSPDLPPGELRDRIIIRLSGSTRSTVNLPVYVNVTRDIAFNPAVVSFGVISPDSNLKKTVKLENFTGQPLKIVKTTSSSPAVSVKSKDLGSRGDLMLELYVNPAKVENELRATVEVQTDNPQAGTLKLPVYGVVPLPEK